MAPKARILAVDDQLYFRTHLEEVLGEAGYDARTAAGGAEALALLEEEGPFDLVLTDLVMPEMDGVETVERIRERWPDQDVIVITAVGDVRSAVSAMRKGAADYLLKPIDPEGLVASIESVLNRQRLEAEHAQLVSENLEYMGRISLFERATGLFSLAGRDAVAARLLELCCQEAASSSGAVWLCGTAENDLALAAERTPGEGEGPPDVAEAPLGELGDAPQLDAERGVLWIPLRREGVLAGLACVAAAEGAAPDDAVSRACGRLGQLGALALERPPLDAHAPPEEPAPLRDPESGLVTLDFLTEVARVETSKAQRFGRSLGLMRVECDPEADPDPDPDAKQDADPDAQPDPGQTVGASIARSLRSTDMVAREAPGLFWVLVTEPDALGGVVLKRRIAARIAQETGVEAWLGLAIFPNHGASVDHLLEEGIARARLDRESLARELQLPPGAPLGEISARLLERAELLPDVLVTAAADLVVGDLVSRPGDRGLLFLAPGAETGSFLAPLGALGRIACATDVFVAVDGDTLPSGPSVHALPVVPGLDQEATWIVRFGEAPPYALVAGALREDGTRPVFHASDPALVEDLAFRLRSEVGFGLRG